MKQWELRGLYAAAVRMRLQNIAILEIKPFKKPSPLATCSRMAVVKGVLGNAEVPPKYSSNFSIAPPKVTPKILNVSMALQLWQLDLQEAKSPSWLSKQGHQMVRSCRDETASQKWGRGAKQYLEMLHFVGISLTIAAKVPPAPPVPWS